MPLILNYGGRSAAGLSGVGSLASSTGQSARTSFLQKKHEDEMELRWAQLVSGVQNQNANRAQRGAEREAQLENAAANRGLRAREGDLNRETSRANMADRLEAQANRRVAQPAQRSRRNGITQFPEYSPGGIYSLNSRPEEGEELGGLAPMDFDPSLAGGGGGFAGGGEGEGLSPEQQQANLADGILDQQAQRNALIDQGLQSGELYYTPNQKKEIARLDNALGSLGTDGRLNEEQRIQAAAEIEQRRNNIVPAMRSPDERPVPLPQQLQQRVNNFGEYADLPWTVDNEGNPQLPRGWQPNQNDPEQQIIEQNSKREDARNKFIQQRIGMTDANDNPLFTADDIEQQANQLFGQSTPSPTDWLAHGYEEPDPNNPNHWPPEPSPPTPGEWAAGMAKEFRGSGDAPSTPTEAPEPQYLHENPIPKSGHTPRQEQTFDSKEDAALYAARMKAEGWNVQVVPGDKSNTTIRGKNGATSQTRQNFTVVASKPRVLSFNEQIDKNTLSLPQYMSDKARQAEVRDRLEEKLDREPTEAEVIQGLSTDYESYKSAMQGLKKSAKWRKANWKEALNAVHRKMSPARKSFFDSNYRQAAMNLYAKEGKYPTNQDIRNYVESEWTKRTATAEDLRRMEFIHSPDIRGQMAESMDQAPDSLAVTEALDKAWRQAHPSPMDVVQQAIDNPQIRGQMAQRLADETGKWPTEDVLNKAITDAITGEGEQRAAKTPANRAPFGDSKKEAAAAQKKKTELTEAQRKQMIEADVENLMGDPNAVRNAAQQIMKENKSKRTLKRFRPNQKQIEEQIRKTVTEQYKREGRAAKNGITPAMQDVLDGKQNIGSLSPEDQMKLSIQTFIPRPKTKEEYDKLESGTVYIDKTGKRRRKK